VLGDNPVILLVNEPIPVPSDVFVESDTSKPVLDEAFHTTPLAVIGEPPSAVMFPPLTAVEVVTEPAATVAARVAKEPADVVKLICAP
jgi:hypothetical protein